MGGKNDTRRWKSFVTFFWLFVCVDVGLHAIIPNTVDISNMVNKILSEK